MLYFKKCKKKKQVTEFTWRSILLGERKCKKEEGEGKDWPMRTGAAEKKGEAEGGGKDRETGRESERRREKEKDGRWAGPF